MGPEGGFTRHKHGWLRAGMLGASTGVPPGRRRSRGWAKQQKAKPQSKIL